MAFTLNLQGLKNVADVNKLTTVLIELDGVEHVEVAREWAEVEGRVNRAAVIKAVERAGFKVKG